MRRNLQSLVQPALRPAIFAPVQIIPYTALRPDTLTALVEEFVTRDGAVHGHADTPLQVRTDAVRRQLTTGHALIVYDAEAETCTIVLAAELSRFEEPETRLGCAGDESQLTGQ